jgi:pyridoxal 5'-phosphate synthase pdxS subunit
MIRSKGEAGTGDVSNATTHMRTIRDEMKRLASLAPEDELYVAAKELQAPYDLVAEVARDGDACPWCCSPPVASRPRPTRP